MRPISSHPLTSPQRKQGLGFLPCLRRGLAVSLLALSVQGAAAETIKLTPRDFLLGPEVVADKDGTVRLAHSVLVADEVGATDQHQTEGISDRIQAKKVLRLDSAEATSAELFIFHGGKQIQFNGQPLGKSEKLISTGWTRIKVPVELLKAGDNEVVFSGGGSLLLEPSRQPGRSFKSTDGGKTWSNQIGKSNDQQGEYLVRLRLGRYAPRGQALSPIIDLWNAGSNGIGTPGRLVVFRGFGALQQAQADGTQRTFWLRTGSTPTPDGKTWTAWTDLTKDYQPDAAAAGHRWAQLRFDLSTTRPQATPRLPAELPVSFDREAIPGKDSVHVLASEGPAVRPAAVPFVYQEPSPRLKLLRERYQLDKVIAPGKTEMEQLMLLRHWIRNQWHTAWEGGSASWMPPWDALIILESKDQADCLTMCTHYAAVFTQCSQALGWNARHCILDHHCVSEVWVEQHRKWVMMDTGNSKKRADVGLHFEKEGVPLSARELLVAHRDSKTDGIQVCFTPGDLALKIAALCRPVPAGKEPAETRPDRIPLAELKKYPVCQIENYRRYAFPARNNYLASLFPGELYQGFSAYFYDGYWWVGDSPDEPKLSPEYSRHLSPDRPQDSDWSINGTRIHLARTAKAGELQVNLESGTPNLARLERWENEAWKPVSASFVWKLQAGENTLKVRSVNRWDRVGAESQVRVRLTP